MTARETELSLRLMNKLRAIVALGVVAGLLAGGCGGSTSLREASAQAGNTEALQISLSRYRSYLREHAHWLVHWTTKLKRQIAAGHVRWASPFYAIARVHFSDVEAVARGQEPVLTDQIEDRRSGFHRLEKGLMQEETTRGLERDAKRLVLRVEALRRRLQDVPLTPRQLLTDAADLMRLTATVKMSGQAEPYSQLDLIDIAADVEGAEAAAGAAESCLGQKSRSALDSSFRLAFDEVKELGVTAREEGNEPEAGAGMHYFSELSKQERQHLATHLRELAAALRRAATTLPAGRHPRC